MAIFRPPTDNWVTTTLPEIDPKTGAPVSDEIRLANRLARFRQPTARGRNVFLLNDGTYIENEPADFSTIRKIYYGGHDHVVDSAEVASLTAAGYGAYIEA